MSISEVDSGDDHSHLQPSLNGLLSSRSQSSTITTLGDFKKSIENEKNIRKIVLNFDINSQNATENQENDKIVTFLERNYKLQLQTLLEEVNQLKLDKKIMEKKIDMLRKSPDSNLITENLRADETQLNYKIQLEAKESVIKEMEFQNNQLRNENNQMKLMVESQSKQIEVLSHDLADYMSLKDLLEEKEDDISHLKRRLEDTEQKQAKLVQENSYLKNENTALKIKSQNTSFVAPNHLNQHQNGFNKSIDQSFISQAGNGGSGENLGKQSYFYQQQHSRAVSESMAAGQGILNISEINEDFRTLTPSTFFKSKMRVSQQQTTNAKKRKNKNSIDEEKSVDRTLSLRALQDYEKNIQKDDQKQQKTSENNAKTLDRLIEVKRIKNYYLEMQNQKLMAMLDGTADTSGKENDEDDDFNGDHEDIVQDDDDDTSPEFSDRNGGTSY